MGFVLVGYAWWTVSSLAAFRATATHVEGTYVESRVNGEGRRMVSVFVPTSDGGGVTHWLQATNRFVSLRSADDPVPILVSPSDPADIRIDDPVRGSPQIFGLIGLALVGLSALGLVVRLRTR